MELLNHIVSLILRSMTDTHHAIVIILVAYAIRYCSSACYDQSNNPITCITSPINAALEQKIEASNTCGKPPEGYCFLGPQRTCQVCDGANSDLSHPPNLMVDKFSLTNITWWQSQTWWTSNQIGLSKMFEPLVVNITLTLRKRYLISGGVYVTFKTERPKKMVIERSRDFGKTWQVYQYYAKNCRSSYNLQADPAIDPRDPFKAICSELYSGEFPRYGGVVHFDPRTRYEPADYYNTNVHRYLDATAIRLKLEYPGTDGREYINEESTLNQYFYAINDLRVDARCDCNGHGEFCDLIDDNEVCDCKHFTTGDDCNICLPMYRNRIWMPGNSTDANPCEKCQCFDHATSCEYSPLLKQGICNNCIHNTRGVRCDQCIEKYYRNISELLNSPTVCIPCDCYEPGISDDGKCLQTQTTTEMLGQCNCKIGVFGRRCDQCLPGKWGFINPPIGSCFDCDCNQFGTLNNDQNCDPYSGQCACKPHTTGRACVSCKPGFYMFPTSLSTDCRPCPCNVGGAIPSCNPLTGICSCKTGVTGPTCDDVQLGYFFPNFTYVKYEPEFSSPNGTFSWYFLVRNYARFFTGFGFARIDAGGHIAFTFTVPTTAKYFMLLRYSLYHLDWYSHILPQGRELVEWSGSKNMELYLRTNDLPNQWLFTLHIRDTGGGIIKAAQFAMADLMLGDDNSWISSSSVSLNAGNQYTISLTYEQSSTIYGDPWPLLFDSFLLMLDYNTASYYSSITNENIKIEIQSCFQSSRALSTTYNLLSACRPHTFTIDTQLYNQALGCDCFIAGSFVWNTCASYGGQCACKMGYGGRRCDQCVPGYYGNPQVGCSSCSCSVAGSMTDACDHVTGQCFCKKNAHGLKCSECLHGFYHLSNTNPLGCQSCFGYGHLRTCSVATGCVRSYVSSSFTTSSSFDGWRLNDPALVDRTNLLIKTTIGMEYTDEKNEKYFFSAPAKFIGDQLYSYGQLLELETEIFPIIEKLANTQWHVRLYGGGYVALFKFLEEITKTRTTYTVRLHQDYMVNTTKLTEFQFKAMLGQLTALHVGVVYFEPPVTITLKQVRLQTAVCQLDGTNINASLIVGYIENAQCLTGYKGLSCEYCDVGYTRLIPKGGPLINCVQCQCNNRSVECDAQSGICSNCKPGTQGSYCEKCLQNVMEPDCDRCISGYWGLFTQAGGCRPCDCFLPGTEGGNNNACDSRTGQCVCNKLLNVGGRKCNTCKENSYNISLGEELRCQECPVCYGLIENSILIVRHEIYSVQVEIINVVSSLSVQQIVPFHQSISTMNIKLQNLTDLSHKGKLTLSGLDLLWQTLEEKCRLFLTTLQGSTTIKMTLLLKDANLVFDTHNSSLFQYYNIYSNIVASYNMLNTTNKARILQQEVALHQLQLLAKEMMTYTTTATTRANNVLQTKYDLKQKIQLSINAAKHAAQSAFDIRNEAFNLTSKLTPVYSRALEVKNYADTCVISIQSWLTAGTNVVIHARNVLDNIKITIPDHTVNITALKYITTSLSNEYSSNTAKLFTLSSNINAVSLEITKLKTSLLDTQISSVIRKSSLFSTNLIILQNKSNLAIRIALSVKNEALEMLHTVQNFMSIAANAQAAANKALTQVDRVRSSVESALSTAMSISSQIQGPKGTASTALQIMASANQMAVFEQKLINGLYENAMMLHQQSTNAKMLIQGQEIRQYIDSNLTPLVAQCTTYRTQAETAYNSAQKARTDAHAAHALALSAAQKISLLAQNLKTITSVNSGQFQSLLTSIQRVNNLYIALGLTNQIKELRQAYSVQTSSIKVYQEKNAMLIAKINAYKVVYNSLLTMNC